MLQWQLYITLTIDIDIDNCNVDDYIDNWHCNIDITMTIQWQCNNDNVAKLQWQWKRKSRRNISIFERKMTGHVDYLKREWGTRKDISLTLLV